MPEVAPVTKAFWPDKGFADAMKDFIGRKISRGEANDNVGDVQRVKPAHRDGFDHALTDREGTNGTMRRFIGALYDMRNF
jgi:hypothetical protein